MKATETILTLINQYKVTNACFLMAKYRIFDHLDGQKSTKKIAEELKINERALIIMLNIFTASGILQKYGENMFCLKSSFKELLSSDSNYSYLPLIQLESYLAMKHTSINTMEQTLINGCSKDTFNENGKEDQQFIYGAAMDQGARFSSLCVARELSRIKEGKIMDIGGGAGTYSIALCRQNKNIKVDLIDRQEMKEVCNFNILKNGFADRIQFLEGDINSYIFESNCAGVIVSNILHLLPYDKIVNLIKRLSKSLNQGGTAVFHDFFLGESKTEPFVPSIYTLDWMMHGSFFNMSTKELEILLKQNGFKITKIKEYNEIETMIVVAKKT